MESYYAVAKLLVATGVALQCCLLVVQIWALGRHRRLHFVLLVAGAFLGLIYAAVAASPLFVPMGLQTRTLVSQVSLALLAVGGSLGVWGMILLIRSYNQLAQDRTRAQA
jgi:hypothetical protein